MRVQGACASARTREMKNNVLDRVFLLVFSRYRRKKGGDRIEAAWRGASSKVLGYLVPPICGLVTVPTVALYSFLGGGTKLQYRYWGQIGAISVIVLIGFCLDRRFKKYRSSPPLLSHEETPVEARLLLYFRAGALGIFLDSWSYSRSCDRNAYALSEKDMPKSTFFRWIGSTLSGHVVVFAVALTVTLCVAFLDFDYRGGSLDAAQALWDITLCSLGGICAAVMFWYTVSRPRIKRRKDG
jgi:hypothetical protein